MTDLTGPAWVGQDLLVSMAELVPSNANVYGWFDFTMSPPFSIPNGGKITIIFDGTFGQLYSITATDIACYAYGGLTILTQCYLPVPSGNTLIIDVGEDSNVELPIQIFFFGLITYPTAGATISPFSVQVSYLGTPIGTALTFPTITTPPSGTMGKYYLFFVEKSISK